MIHLNNGVSQGTQSTQRTAQERNRLMTSQLSIPIAFVAGVVSFLSPCVLPLVPGYLSMLSNLAMLSGRDFFIAELAFRF